jgi:hypothetical protein
MVAHIYDTTFESYYKPYFFQHCHFWHCPPLLELLLASNQIVDPQVFYMKLTVLSRRTSMTGLKNSDPKTL